ncbi:MAG: TniQ family protein [Clostridia bacterium]|nr:TniQ family protein [Clostridia bacterium]
MERRFTIRIKPYDGESLSSFMIRFSKENAVNFLTLWNMVKRSKKKYAQMSYLYLLNYLPLNILDYSKLVFVTGLKEEEIFKMTLYYVFKKFCINESFDRARFLFGMIRDEEFFYCPACLKEKAYHRLIWTIESITVCLLHGVRLQNTCPNCGSVLKQHEMREIELCPKCMRKLTNSIGTPTSSELEYKEQVWLNESWYQLIQPNEQKFNAQVLGLKALYLLNKKKLEFDRELIYMNIENPKLLPTLLQHARGTLTQKRTIHLQFILSILLKENMSMQKFYDLELPQSFVNAVLIKPDSIKEKPRCKAPWCINSSVDDSLIKIATSYQRNYDGELISFYFICPKCGCEYIYDGKGCIVERTKFIEGYKMLKDLPLGKMNLKELCDLTGLKNEKIRRYIAYFSSNKILKPINKYKKVKVDKKCLSIFIDDIKKGDNVEDIKYRDYWEDNFHYLIHRYNNDVLQTIAKERSKRHLHSNLEEKQKVISYVLKELYENNTKITINSVCTRAGIGHETIRLWGCNNMIQTMKKLQQAKNQEMGILKRKGK